MKILVTGGAGFIGSQVAEYYALKDEEVVVLDNLSRTRYNWDYLERYDNITLVEGDIRDAETLEEVAKDADAIIHAAAQVAVTTSMADPRTDFEINALGTFNVLEAARKSKSSPIVVYCSTNKVYGDNVNRIPVRAEGKRYVFADARYEEGIPEDFPTDLCEHTPYGASKLAGDVYVQDYGRRNEVDTGVFRMSCIYGTRQFGSEDQGWVAHFVISNLLERPLTVYGDGKQVRDVLFVSDLLRAYDAFLKKRDKYSGEVYNIGGGARFTLSLLELLDFLERETGKKSRVAFADWRPSDQKVYISDIGKAKRELGWEPKVSVNNGVKKLIEWVKDNKGLFE